MKGNKREKRIGARAAAARVLWRVEARDAFADLALDAVLDRSGTSEKDRALAVEIVFGVLRWKSLLDFYIAQVSGRPINKIERNAVIALRIGAYQLMMLDRVPASAAVNESVSVAPDKARGFVNAVLRSLASKKGSLKSPETNEDEVERLAVSESHPRWMVEHWIERIGMDSARALCRANNQRPPLTLRVNPLRTGRAAFMRILSREGIKAREGRLSPLAVTLEERADVRQLPGYADGLFAVQDEASQLAVLVLGARPGEIVLDACAAPGTKSLAMMEQMGGQGRVIAVDIHEGRLKRMADESRRLGIKNVTRVTADASAAIEFPERFRKTMFDRVLVDAPCTGLGTIRRRPEIKWRRMEKDVLERSVLQRAILDNVSRLLKPGGTLVYSTCTFTTEENEAVVAPLLHSGSFTQLDPAAELPSAAPLSEHKMLRTWPHLTGTDGFTIFKLKKNR